MYKAATAVFVCVSVCLFVCLLSVTSVTQDRGPSDLSIVKFVGHVIQSINYKVLKEVIAWELL